MPYATLLFDLDHTLYDSDAAEEAAFAHTMRAVGLDDSVSDVDFARYVTINRGMWRMVERGEIDPSEVRTRRFEQFVAELGLDADPAAMAAAFVWGLGHLGELYAGALEVLDVLAGRASLAMVTNGLSDVQRARIERFDLDDYFDAITISSEIGATKPRPEIFDVTFERLGAPPLDSAVMIGDSLTSDIRGGNAYGIATCWYNPTGAVAGDHDVVTHEVAHLAELPDVV